VTLEADGRFRFEVRDTGVGFDEATAAQLFERFKQADGTVQQRFGGTGLGLAISRRLARLMGGDITASSKPRQGSQFTLVLPLPLAMADTPAPELDTWESPLAEPAGRRARILLAEDHPTNRLVVELMLRACDVDLVAVENGAQAIEAFCTQDFDCILMDVEMPVMNGLAAIREIRRREARTGAPPVPVLALSAHASDDRRRQSAAAGATGHLTKPIHPDALLKALGEVLASRGVAADGETGDRPGVALFSG
jgi:CheY-like chemotaxis protein